MRSLEVPNLHVIMASVEDVESNWLRTDQIFGLICQSRMAEIPRPAFV